ncbi:MAG: hypothetical protein J6B82_06665 [Bacteroidaceae bacterium]|nr:hypothetical protein [Bacteroidaceae bacterium]
MVFNAVLFFAVLAITAIFLYLSFTLKRDAEKKKTYEGQYHIELTSDWSGKNLSIYVNDSLLMNGILPDTLVALDIDRFAEEHVLMIVDNETDATTPFNLSKEGSKVIVKKTNDEVVFEETPAR